MWRASSAAEHEPNYCGFDSMSSLADHSTPHAGPEKVAARVEQLYASHSALVRTVCRSVLRSRTEAEDAVQQTFLSAQRGLLNGSSPRDEAAWLVAIARHESFARVQARMREPLPIQTETEAEPAGQDAYVAALRRHEVSELRAAISELPAQQREALLLREMRGLSYEEVASTLSLTRPAVESLLFRARRNLQVRLREALAAFSPAGLLRELATRLGGGFAAPAAAKALALGVGAAVVTGGAVAGPQIIGLGRAPQPMPTGRLGNTRPHSHDLRIANVGSGPMVRGGSALFIGAASGRATTSDHTSGRAATSRTGHSDQSDQSESPTHAISEDRRDTSTTSEGGTSGSDATALSRGDTQTTSSPTETPTTDSNSQSTPTTTTSSGSDSSGSPDSSGTSGTSGSSDSSESSGGTTTTSDTAGG